MRSVFAQAYLPTHAETEPVPRPPILDKLDMPPKRKAATRPEKAPKRPKPSRNGHGPKREESGETGPVGRVLSEAEMQPMKAPARRRDRSNEIRLGGSAPPHIRALVERHRPEFVVHHQLLLAKDAPHADIERLKLAAFRIIDLLEELRSRVSDEQAKKVMEDTFKEYSQTAVDYLHHHFRQFVLRREKLVRCCNRGLAATEAEGIRLGP